METSKDYLAQKEKEIIASANEVINFKIDEYVGENKTYFNKFYEAIAKVQEKMFSLDDYYKVWNSNKSIKFTTQDAVFTIDKKINDLIIKTYQDIEKLCLKFNEIKTKFDQWSLNNSDESESK